MTKQEPTQDHSHPGSYSYGVPRTIGPTYREERLSRFLNDPRDFNYERVADDILRLEKLGVADKAIVYHHFDRANAPVKTARTVSPAYVSGIFISVVLLALLFATVELFGPLIGVLILLWFVARLGD